MQVNHSKTYNGLAKFKTGGFGAGAGDLTTGGCGTDSDVPDTSTTGGLARLGDSAAASGASVDGCCFRSSLACGGGKGGF